MDETQLDAKFWRGRAEELQHALNSRVVIEQAKGVLAERLGLDIARAFNVLRGAARSERMKAHDLARTVVRNKDTPQTIISFLARNPDPSEEEIRSAIAGNLCRCTGYIHIDEAIRDAAGKVPAAGV